MKNSLALATLFLTTVPLTTMASQRQPYKAPKIEWESKKSSPQTTSTNQTQQSSQISSQPPKKVETWQEKLAREKKERTQLERLPKTIRAQKEEAPEWQQKAKEIAAKHHEKGGIALTAQEKQTRQRALNDELMNATLSRSPDKIAYFIHQGAAVNSTDNFLLNLPLTAAVNLEYTDIAEQLLSLGALANLPGSENRTSLHTAIWMDNGPIACLLAKETGINSRDIQGITPVNEAILANAVSALAALIAAGADLHTTDAQGRTPIQLYTEMAANPFYVGTKNNPNRIIEDILTSSFQQFCLAPKMFLDELSLKGQALQNELNTLLLYSALAGRLDLVKLLLQRGANLESTYPYRFWCPNCKKEEEHDYGILSFAAMSKNQALVNFINDLRSSARLPTVNTPERSRLYEKSSDSVRPALMTLKSLAEDAVALGVPDSDSEDDILQAAAAEPVHLEFESEDFQPEELH